MSESPTLAAVKPLPQDERRSVIVIGAGVVGLSSALWLQRYGHSVTIVDENPPLRGADFSRACSYGNAANIALNACLPVPGPGIAWRVPNMLADRASPLSVFWRDLPQLLPWLAAFLRAGSKEQFERSVGVLGQLIRFAEAGHAPLMEESATARLKRPRGALHLFHTEQTFEAAMPGIRKREEQGVRFELLDAGGVCEREPHLAPLYVGGVHYTDCYSIDEPLTYAVGLGEAFQARHGRFAKGRVSAIVPRDECVDVIVDGIAETADRVVLAAGAWSARLARTMGDQVLLNTERGYHVLFPEGEKLLSTPTMYPEHGFYMTPLSEGLRCAGTVELGGLDQPHRPKRCAIIAQKSLRLLPGLGEPTREWLGFRPSTPDSLPFIGESPRDWRVVHAYGHGHIGLTLAGITGRIVADLVSGQMPPVDTAPFDPGRFAVV